MLSWRFDSRKLLDLSSWSPQQLFSTKHWQRNYILKLFFVILFLVIISAVWRAFKSRWQCSLYFGWFLFSAHLLSILSTPFMRFIADQRKRHELKHSQTLTLIIRVRHLPLKVYHTILICIECNRIKAACIIYTFIVLLDRK